MKWGHIPGDNSFLDHRVRLREDKEITVPIWERSPSPPRVKDKKRRKKSRDESSDSESTDSGSNSDSSNNSSSESDSHRHKHRSSRKRKRHSSKKKRKKRKKSHNSSDNSSDSDDLSNWVEKEVEITAAPTTGRAVGPVPLPKVEIDSGGYGGAMLPGEAEAYAAYVQADKRIPRRGEVGLNSDEISKFEELGYVMSGSRHKRMNAVRIRKENQIYSAEEKRALALFNYEEKAKRENKILSDFREIISTKVSSARDKQS
eukprot:TRINITY_DN16024_c0_g1_i1.p1 TRINITY_DN16024_c0_g1~~TRINITY_DN16024_c0_g1_i1.p1  ORF type:complete len:295 (-),score=66.16 TRINITY_DN16024_c0_g1_i1:52-828(-)